MWRSARGAMPSATPLLRHSRKFISSHTSPLLLPAFSSPCFDYAQRHHSSSLRLKILEVAYTLGLGYPSQRDVWIVFGARAKECGGRAGNAWIAESLRTLRSENYFELVTRVRGNAASVESRVGCLSLPDQHKLEVARQTRPYVGLMCWQS